MKDKVKRLKYYLLISAVLVIVTKILFSAIQPSAEIDERVFLPVVFPEATAFSEKKAAPKNFASKKNAPKVYEVFDEFGDIIGYCYNTYDIVPEIKGYAGPVKVLAGLKVSGDISGVNVVSHNETKIYMQKLIDDKFAEQFSFKKVTDGFVLDKDLDGVTHATVTAEAIANSVKKSSAIVANSYLGMIVPVEEKEAISKKELLNSVVLLIITVAAVVLFLKKKSNTFATMKEKDALITGFRDLLLIVVIAFVGFYKSSPVSVTNIINIFYLRFPDFRNVFFYVLIGGFFLVTILFGRLYCGYLCPFSALIEFVEKIKTKKLKTYDRDLAVIKYIFLWAILIIVLYFDKVEISSFEPYLAIFSANKNVYMWTAVGIIVVFTMFHKRIWCRYFCAVGAFCAIITKFAPFRAAPPKSCDSCGACEAVCPVEIDFKDIENFAYEECIACRKCHEFCIRK